MFKDNSDSDKTSTESAINSNEMKWVRVYSNANKKYEQINTSTGEILDECAIVGNGWEVFRLPDRDMVMSIYICVTDQCIIAPSPPKIRRDRIYSVGPLGRRVSSAPVAASHKTLLAKLLPPRVLAASHSTRLLRLPKRRVTHMHESCDTYE